MPQVSRTFTANIERFKSKPEALKQLAHWRKHSKVGTSYRLEEITSRLYRGHGYKWRVREISRRW